MTDIVLAPLANYPTGSRQFGPANIPNGLSRATIKIARCTTASPTIWPNEATTLKLIMEISQDGGATWRNLWGLDVSGGITQDRNGADAAYSIIGGLLPVGTGRRIRATVIIANGPLRSTLILTV